MKIVVIADDTAGAGLAVGHGLSLWVETRVGNLLFDTGQGPSFQANVDALAIPLDTARAIVLSHGHYDHTGGLPFALGRNATAPVFLHPDARLARFSIRDNTPREISMPASARKALQGIGDRARWTTGPVEVLPGVHVTGPIPRRAQFEDVGGPFFLDEKGLNPDALPDDQAVWIETGPGIVVLLGCAHSGVVNTLDCVCQQSGRTKIHAVVGGMHLGAASAQRLEATAQVLKRCDVQMVAPCHCTGEEAVRFLRSHLPARVTDCAAGSVLTFKES